MPQLINLQTYPVKNVLPILLQDKTTKKNIIWATDEYRACRQEAKQQITADALLGMNPVLLQPRVLKSQEEQAARTRQKAEVMTPSWLCNMMNSHLDEEWFGRKDVFNVPKEDHTWMPTAPGIEFPEGKDWKAYVDSRRLEITCGEAPYLVSRYDTSTGRIILPPGRRIGLLDRKLRIVDENTDTVETWLKWAYRAFQACYGYEWQGDSLLIARINLIMTFVDYYRHKWKDDPDIKQLKKTANIIAWNIWQMDGLKDCVPLGTPFEEHHQYTIFDLMKEEKEEEDVALPCRIYNWRSNRSLLFKDLKER